MKTAARNSKHGRSTCFRKRNVFRLPLNESRECFCWIRRGRSFHVDRPKTKKARKPKVESGARNLEAKSIRSRAESMGGCVKLKIVTEIRQSNHCDTFIAESVYSVHSLSDWEPLEKLKQKCDMWSDLHFFSMCWAAQFCMRQRLWTEEADKPERRELQ